MAICISGNIYYCTLDITSYYEYMLSLKMAFTAETCCWYLPIDKVVFRFNLHLFYLLVYLNTTGMPCLKYKILSFIQPDNGSNKSLGFDYIFWLRPQVQDLP
jgi:hypothetical protein